MNEDVVSVTDAIARVREVRQLIADSDAAFLCRPPLR